MRFQSPVQSLEVSLLWLNQSIIRSNLAFSYCTCSCLSLQSNGISCLILIFNSWEWFQLFRMLNLQTCCNNTIRSIEESLTCIIQLWRSNIAKIWSSSTSMIIQDCWLKKIEAHNILVCHISIWWIHVILNTPSRTIVVQCCWHIGWSMFQSVWQIVIKTSNILMSYAIINC